MSNDDISKLERNNKKVIRVDFDKLNWPDEINNQFPIEVAMWLISDDLTHAVAVTAASARVHVISKPRSKKEAYLVTGGFIPYLVLMKFGWASKVECVLDDSISHDDLPRLFYNDVCNYLFSLKAGPVATAAKAAIFIKLLELGENAGAPSCFRLSFRHLNSRNLLKELVGFDPRSLKRAKVDKIEDEIVSQIEAILQMKASSRCSDGESTGGVDDMLNSYGE